MRLNQVQKQFIIERTSIFDECIPEIVFQPLSETIILGSGVG